MSHYFGANPLITVEKTVNGVEADTVPEALFVRVGDPVSWRYLLTNTGNVPLIWGLSDSPTQVIGCHAPADPAARPVARVPHRKTPTGHRPACTRTPRPRPAWSPARAGWKHRTRPMEPRTMSASRLRSRS